MLVVRLLGKRMSGQISLTELSVMITLGAIVSPVMQLPDRGIFFGVLVLFVALFFQRGLNWLAFKNEKIEHLSQGKMSMLIKDGTLVLEEMEKTHITKQQVFSFLREKRITNLGKVKRGYLEAKRSVDLKSLFHQLITEDPALADRFRNARPLEKPAGWGLPLASEQRRVYGDGYLLTGDAAAMICPTTGEGIGPAMISGYIAAQFIERAVKNNRYDKSMFLNYDREIYKRLQGDVKKYKILRKASPMLYNSLIKLLSGMGISRYYFNKNVARWIETAKNKPLEVEM